MLSYLVNNYFEIIKLVIQHITLVLISIIIAISIALPISLLLSKTRIKWLSVLAQYFFNAIYTIPGLALLALLIPFTGLGSISAIIALVLYSQAILVRNITLAFNSVDKSVIEAAKAMGLNSLQLFYKIELPLALPLILSGIRISTITIIALASVAAWINAGGLGSLIFEGLYQNNFPKIIWGTIFIVAMAIFVNYYILSLEKEALSIVGKCVENGKI